MRAWPNSSAVVGPRDLPLWLAGVGIELDPGSAERRAEATSCRMISRRDSLGCTAAAEVEVSDRGGSPSSAIGSKKQFIRCCHTAEQEYSWLGLSIATRD